MEDEPEPGVLPGLLVSAAARLLSIANHAKAATGPESPRTGVWRTNVWFLMSVEKAHLIQLNESRHEFKWCARTCTGAHARGGNTASSKTPPPTSELATVPPRPHDYCRARARARVSAVYVRVHQRTSEVPSRRIDAAAVPPRLTAKTTTDRDAVPRGGSRRCLAGAPPASG